jgi:hypothetical protein
MKDTYGDGTPLRTIASRNELERHSRWPVYDKPESALCYKCGNVLTKTKKSAYDGCGGNYQGVCEPCNTITWFNVDSTCLLKQRFSSN